MPRERFQFTLSGLMLLVALSAGYFWLIGHPEIGAPLVLIGMPLGLAFYFLLVVVPREVASDVRPGRSWRWLGWRLPARRRKEAADSAASLAPNVPLKSFERFERPAATCEPGYGIAEGPPHDDTATPTIPMSAPSSTDVPQSLADIVIEAIEVTIVNLPCKSTFHLAGGDFSQAGQPTPRALVKVVGSNGVAGWGEVTPCPTWCYETSETITSTLRKYLGPALVGMPAWNLDAICRKMDRVINPGATIGQPLAKSGIDVAVHDMLARTLGVPLYVLLGGKRLDQIQLSYIVSAKDPDEAAAQAKRGLELGYTAFKIKVGLHGEEQDFAIVAAVHEVAPKGTFLWVDANQGYGLDNAIGQAKRMATLGVAAFEQPLRGSRPSEFRRLVEMGAVPIAIDESLCSPTDLVEYIKAGAVDLPVAKVQRCGGLWWSGQFCSIAEAAGLRLMGSGLCETDLGLATGVHLFAAFGIDLPCDLNGRQFVESAYLSRTLTVAQGRVTVPDAPGSGVEVDESLVRRFDAGL
jgi:muconate cycloisomerase